MDAINETICGRLMSEVAEIALAIARTNAPAMEKLDQLLTAIHHHTKMMLVKERHMHDLIVTATEENWAIIRVHIERMVMIFEVIIREGPQAGEFEIEDAAEAARAVQSAFTPVLHPTLIAHCVQHGEDTEVGLRDQIRFILQALGKSDSAWAQAKLGRSSSASGLTSCSLNRTGLPRDVRGTQS